MARTVSRTGASPCAMRSSAWSGAVWVMANSCGSEDGVRSPGSAERAEPASPVADEGVAASGWRSAGWPSVERGVQGDGGVDQGQVRERLREVADLLAGEGDLLGVQPDVVGVG